MRLLVSSNPRCSFDRDSFSIVFGCVVTGTRFFCFVFFFGPPSQFFLLDLKKKKKKKKKKRKKRLTNPPSLTSPIGTSGENVKEAIEALLAEAVRRSNIGRSEGAKGYKHDLSEASKAKSVKLDAGAGAAGGSGARGASSAPAAAGGGCC